MQNYNWDANIYAIGGYSYYPTITFVCSDGNIVLEKEPAGGGGEN